MPSKLEFYHFLGWIILITCPPLALYLHDKHYNKICPICWREVSFERCMK